MTARPYNFTTQALAATVAATAAANVDTDGVRGMYATFQGSWDGVGTISYKLEGRLSTAHDWVDVVPAQAADYSAEVIVFPLMRVNVLAATGGAKLLTTLSGPNKIWA